MMGPVCDEDLKVGRLCKICEAKLKAGQIGAIDFEVMKAIDKLENKRFLIVTEMVRAIDLDDTILVFAKGNVGMLIGKEGKNVKELEKSLGKKVRIIEMKDPKEIIQQVLGRAKLLAVNRVFKPEQEELKVILSQGDRNALEPKKEKLEKALNTILKKPVEISFS